MGHGIRPTQRFSQLGTEHFRADLYPVVPQHTHLPSGNNLYFHWLRPNLGQALSSCSGHPKPGKTGVITVSILVVGKLKLRKFLHSGQVTKEEAITGTELGL